MWVGYPITAVIDALDRYENRPLGLVLLRGSLLGSLLGLGLGSRLTLGTLVLHILIIDVNGLIDLGAESILLVEPERKILVHGR